jgi:hypothetical protein
MTDRPPVPVDAEQFGEWRNLKDGGALRQFFGPCRDIDCPESAPVDVVIHGFQRNDGSVERLIDICQYEGTGNPDDDGCIRALSADDARELGEALLSLADHIDAFISLLGPAASNA